ncbi:MAG: hypothetical protein KGI97_04000 [Alphaproteobacteria bacterium]|nr:hypothetical protein [Alphaproteobacteria bacterium]
MPGDKNPAFAARGTAVDQKRKPKNDACKTGRKFGGWGAQGNLHGWVDGPARKSPFTKHGGLLAFFQS